MDAEANQRDFANRRDHGDELKKRNLASLKSAPRLNNKYGSRIEVVRGTIVDQDVVAIVNAANELLTGGGGIDGVIHEACGAQLLAECEKLPLNSLGARCMTGEAKLTPAFKIKAKFVIHTVGPYLDSQNRTQPKLLFDCYYNSLLVAQKNGAESIAFPAISTGYYGYPVAEGAEVAYQAIDKFCVEHATSPMKIKLVLFDELSYKIYAKMFE